MFYIKRNQRDKNKRKQWVNLDLDHGLKKEKL